MNGRQIDWLARGVAAASLGLALVAIGWPFFSERSTSPNDGERADSRAFDATSPSSDRQDANGPGKGGGEMPNVQEGELFPQHLAEQLARCVVHLTSPAAESDDRRVDSVLALPARVAGGLGSGTVVRSDGYIVTNAHVVAEYEPIHVYLNGEGPPHVAQVITRDTRADLALLKIEADRLAAFDFGDRTSLRAGQVVFACGSPLRSLSGSLARGIVSHPTCNLGSGVYSEVIVSSLLIHPGFSGGALLDRHGRLIGIHVATVGENLQGMSLAIPIDRVSAWLARHLPGAAASIVGWVVEQQGEMIRVAKVHAETPAAVAGVVRDDLIVAWDGFPVRRVDELRDRVATVGAGDSVIVRLRREKGQELTVRLEIVPFPAVTTPP